MTNDEARTEAIRARDAVSPKPTSLISYQSAGRVLALGEAQSLRQIEALALDCHIEQIPIDKNAPKLEVSGYLGNYIVSRIDQQGNITTHRADAILDLQALPALNREMLPPGYLHRPAEGLDQRVLKEELTSLSGEFEKPRYFSYDASICAHSVNGSKVCRQCIDTCPAEAIRSIGEAIEVDPYLCQGGGSCTTVCPSGAISYAYPTRRDQGKRLREMIKAYREQGGKQARVLFHGEYYAPDSYLETYHNLLPVAVEELGSVGAELCLSALAFGAQQVILLIDDQVPRSTLFNLENQLDWLQAVLAGLGLHPDCVTTCTAQHALPEAGIEIDLEPAIFDMQLSKRNAIFDSLDYLVGALGGVNHDEIVLPALAPLGEIIIDAKKCTLCLACVGACPGKALQDGSNREIPEVSFIEAKCIQCSACVQTCPEDAISLRSRMLFDREQRNRTRTLNSDSAFACIGCGKPFAPTSVIRKMQEKLKDHYMFASDRAMDRLKMCDDCRVADIVQDPESMGGQFDPSTGFRQ